MKWHDGNVWTANLEVGTLAAIEVVCAWDLPAPVEVAFNLDPQAPTIPPDNGSADVPPAVDNSSSQDTISKGSSEQPPQAALIELVGRPEGIFFCEQDPGWEALTEAQHQEGTAISGPAALSLHMQELVQQAAPASISAETLNHVHDTASLEETPQTGLSKIQSGQEAAPAGAPEKEQQADESPEQQAVPSKQAPEEQQQQQPQQIQPGVQVIEQPGSTGELPTYLFSFDEHQDMQPFVETESEDEMDISAARESDNNPEGTQPAAVADPPPTSHDDLQLAQQRASLPPVKPHLPKSSRSRSAPQPQAALDARGASAPRPVKRSKPAAEEALMSATDQLAASIMEAQVCADSAHGSDANLGRH
ncbi:hypothetical protein WJX84_010962 [Apatococcus fuscideae]|uniref:Uncharacterized protein n=1 Tax=Apatococcus fuscideae TaxID=2026836 RepID=A0AAW1S8R9_9CHLO